MTVSRTCMGERIKGVILKRISDGIYAPGDRLIELKIAAEFQTSQAPVREALSELAAMRVVETEPYKGARVREISASELEECLQIRAVLENLAAEQIKESFQSRLHLLKEKALETVKAAREGDVQAYSEANVEFHRMIVANSSNETLIQVWDSLAPEVRMRMAVQVGAHNLNECAQDHLDIVEAFSEGDNRFAGRLLKKHAESALIKQLHDASVSGQK